MLKQNNSVEATITRGRVLTITLIAMVIVFLIWNVDFLSPVAYPFRLFVTYVHEASHSIAAIATGGEVLRFTVSSDGSGLATTRGGLRAVILPAGYLGTAIFGATLFYLLNTLPYARTISVILGVSFVIITFLYARPDHTGAPIAALVGLLTGAGLIGLGVRGRWALNLLVLNIIAMMVSLNAVFDGLWLIQNTSVSLPTNGGVIRNDAAAFSELVGLPPWFWAMTWAAISVLFISAAVYYSLLRPMLRGSARPTNPASKQRERQAEEEIDFSQFT